MKTLVLLYLSMVGTAWGQTTTMQPNTGTVNGLSTDPNVCWVGNSTALGWRWCPNGASCQCVPYSGVGVEWAKLPTKHRADIVAHEPVDVPAIQEKRQNFYCFMGIEVCDEDGRFLAQADDSCINDRRYELNKSSCLHPTKWTCADKDRVLLTSVNGKRHTCHAIEELKDTGVVTGDFVPAGGIKVVGPIHRVQP